MMKRERDEAVAESARLSEQQADLQRKHLDACEQRDRLLILNDPDGAAAAANARDKIPLEYADARDLLLKELNPEQEFRTLVRVMAKKYPALRQAYRYYASSGYSSTAAATRLKITRRGACPSTFAFAIRIRTRLRST